jgi:hypothetical protein
VLTQSERTALETELAECRKELRKFEGAVDFWGGTEADDGSNALIRAESMIMHYKERVAQIEALLTQPPF